MKFDPARIVGAGAVCAIGGGLQQISASVRVGISGMAASSVHDRFFEPMKMALVPEDALLPLVPEVEALPLTSRQRRMLRLATPALQQAVADATDHPRVPLFLGLPEAHPNRPAPLDATFLKHLQTQVGLQFETKSSQIFPHGRAAGLLALEAGMRCLTERRAERVVVGGVDSYLDLALLAELDAEQRLLGERVMDGFVPGEGAAFVMLNATTKPERGARATLGVLSAASAQDAGHRYGDQPAKGEGLAHALEGMLERLKAPPDRVRTTAADIVHPADCFGDTGAAAGMLLLALAADMLNNEHKPGPALVWASSDGPASACAYVDRLV
jgi:3-oxoacyl-[acyl-carrier-protein] synthase-1